ncbi:MAG: tail fiber domain-containing protein [Marinilabiliales bacterium]|nr:tail fiber domain-containing protein [Marinilabiliales bacterium]
MVEKLNGYYFFWNSGTDQSRQIGFSAQEVNEVLPEVVSKGEDGYLSVEYGKITPLLAEAIKQLKAENDRLSLENDQLKTEQVLLQTLYNNLVETDQKTINRLEKLEKILMKSIE